MSLKKICEGYREREVTEVNSNRPLCGCINFIEHIQPNLYLILLIVNFFFINYSKAYVFLIFIFFLVFICSTVRPSEESLKEEFSVGRLMYSGRAANILETVSL